MSPYREHLKSSGDLITTYEATRAGFVSLALEKNKRATPFIAEARLLQSAAKAAKTPIELTTIDDIQRGMLTASGVSDKAMQYLTDKDRENAINGLIEKFLLPAGEQFVEELVFRFLLVRGDTLGGSMRNIGGALAQRKLTRTILSALSLSGASYIAWLDSRSKKWIEKSPNDTDIENTLKGVFWASKKGERILLYNYLVPSVSKNVDLFLLTANPSTVDLKNNNLYLALGELKGGIDPAGADEHWKTASKAFTRITNAFSGTGKMPSLFFIGAAIQNAMAEEIWEELKSGTLNNAANLNDEDQMASISRWLCNL